MICKSDQIFYTILLHKGKDTSDFISILNQNKKGAFFSSPLGFIGRAWPYTLKYLPKTLAWLHFWSICTFFINEIFFKKFEIFFDFLNIQRGDPVDIQKIEKKFKFFEKNFINKICAYGPKMKPCQGFRQIFWCIWSGLPNNPRGEGKKGSFFYINLIFYIQI